MVGEEKVFLIFSCETFKASIKFVVQQLTKNPIHFSISETFLLFSLTLNRALDTHLRTNIYISGLANAPINAPITFVLFNSKTSSI